MDVLELNFRLMGLTQVALALIHLGFERRFEWKRDLAGISLLNRQLMYVHTFFVAFAVFLMGCLNLFAPDALLTPSRLSVWVSVGLTVFWAARLYTQFLVFDRRLWLGRGFETVAHVVFGFAWLWYTASYLAVAARGWAR